MTIAKERAIDIIRTMPDDYTITEVVRILVSILRMSAEKNSDKYNSVEAFDNFKKLCKPAPNGFDYDYDRVKFDAMENEII